MNFQKKRKIMSNIINFITWKWNRWYYRENRYYRLLSGNYEGNQRFQLIKGPFKGTIFNYEELKYNEDGPSFSTKVIGNRSIENTWLFQKITKEILLNILISWHSRIEENPIKEREIFTDDATDSIEEPSPERAIRPKSLASSEQGTL